MVSESITDRAAGKVFIAIGLVMMFGGVLTLPTHGVTAGVLGGGLGLILILIGYVIRSGRER